MRRQAARMLVRIGLALLVMALLVRLAEPKAADRAADDLAIAASAAVVVLGAAFVRLGRD